MPGPFFSKLLENLNEHDTVISKKDPLNSNEPTLGNSINPLLALKGSKRIRGD